MKTSDYRYGTNQARSPPTEQMGGTSPKLGGRGPLTRPARAATIAYVPIHIRYWDWNPKKLHSQRTGRVAALLVRRLSTPIRRAQAAGTASAVPSGE